MELSHPQAETLRAIADYIAVNGHPPSVRDIRDRLGLSSMSATQRLLVQLRDLGVIEWTSGKSRTIRVKS